jgi:DNA-binding CsgD family transcriptional regulator
MQAWPLIGRERELASIATALYRPTAGGVVVAGPPGVGKTYLAREALERARAQGATVEWAVATEAAADIPFGPVAHLLPRAVGDVSTRLDLLRRAADGLAERAHGGPVVLGVDDAHLLDGPSAALVHHLVLTSTASVLLTLRTDASATDAVTALWKDGLVERLEVRPLSQRELELLVPAVVGGQVDGFTLRQLWELCRGNALFLRELVDGALQDGTLAQVGEVWRMRGRLAATTRLAEMIQARLGRLGDDARAVAEVVALGEPLGAALLESVVAASALDAADRAGLVEATPDARRLQLRLVHPLYSELLRATVPPMRRRAIHRQLAEALQRLGGRRRNDVLRLAVWRLESGVPADPELLFKAAKVASGTFFEHSLGERLARAAVDAGGGARAERILAETLFTQGRAGEAEKLLAALQRRSSAEDGAQTAMLRANNLFWGLGRAVEAEQVLRAAEDVLRSSSWWEESVVLRATMAFSRGETRVALDDVVSVLARTDPAGRTGLHALALATGAWAFSGRAEHAVAAAETAVVGGSRAAGGQALAADRLLTALCVAYRMAGRLGDAEALAEGHYQTALDRHAEELQAPWALLRGENALVRGQLEMAAAWLREAAFLLRERGWFFGVYSRAWCLGSLAEANALLGGVDAAAAALAEADAETPERFFIPNRERGRVWLAAARGEISAARSLALEAARTAAELGSYLVEAVGLHDVARLGAPAVVVDRLEALAGRVEGPLPGAYALHAAALAKGDAPGLDAAASRFEAIGTMLLAAEAAAEASRAHADAGRRASALASSQRASRLLEGCQARPRTPSIALLRLPDEMSRLTVREREVGTLAAQGLSNRDIAERLVVSIRTVDTHLHNLYAKLGVSSRAALRAIFPVDP